MMSSVAKTLAINTLISQVMLSDTHVAVLLFHRQCPGNREKRVSGCGVEGASLAYWDEKTSRFAMEDEPVRLMVGGSS